MVQIEVGKNSVPEVGSLPVPPTPEWVLGEMNRTEAELVSKFRLVEMVPAREAA